MQGGNASSGTKAHREKYHLATGNEDPAESWRRTRPHGSPAAHSDSRDGDVSDPGSMRCCKCCPWLKDVKESMECALLQLRLRAYCFFLLLLLPWCQEALKQAAVVCRQRDDWYTLHNFPHFKELHGFGCYEELPPLCGKVYFF